MATDPKRDEMIETEFVRDHINGALIFGREEWVQGVMAVLEGTLRYSPFESPLELAFYAWWHVMLDRRGDSDHLRGYVQREVTVGEKSFRLDLAFEWQDSELETMAAKIGLPLPKVAIELDGHDFHERTKEQVAIRDARDRALLGAGWTVFHVSGSAFHRNPEECVWGVMLDVRGVFWKFERQVWTSCDKAGLVQFNLHATNPVSEA